MNDCNNALLVYLIRFILQCSLTTLSMLDIVPHLHRELRELSLSYRAVGDRLTCNSQMVCLTPYTYPCV